MCGCRVRIGIPTVDTSYAEFGRDHNAMMFFLREVALTGDSRPTVLRLLIVTLTVEKHKWSAQLPRKKPPISF